MKLILKCVKWEAISAMAAAYVCKHSVSGQVLSCLCLACVNYEKGMTAA